ncbi:MAG: bifunctional 4-hydroxy-2-oxoglutarate aldolase/2-dehydro-3-deoxy-phosphogluconate aldolase [Cyclobacteriaceae bacterium]
MRKTKQEVLEAVASSKVVVIVRASSSDGLIESIEAISKGGLPVIEVTYNTPGCLDVVSEIAEKHKEITVGVGTIRTGEQAKEAIAAGASYLVTPLTSKEIMDEAKEHDVPVMMGAFSPTEMHMADMYGADFVKIFPADSLGIPYMQAVRATLKHAKFIPTGGVDLNNCEEWMEAGAVALGMGSAMYKEGKSQEELTQTAAAFKEKLDKY